VTRRHAWILLAACLMLLATPFAHGTAGRVAFAGIVVMFPVALVAGARSVRRAPAWLGVGLAVLGLWLLVGALVIVLAPDRTTPSWTGLPVAGNWMLLGLGLAPLPLAVGLYVASFGRRG
jgi:hypothetical protein